MIGKLLYHTYLCARGLAHVITHSTFIPQKVLNSSMKKQPLPVDSSNSPGPYLRPGVYFLETPQLVIETSVSLNTAFIQGNTVLDY